MEGPGIQADTATKGIEILQQRIYSALETYSNVHRGSGHHSQVTTRLFEQARAGVLEYLGLSSRKYVVIFCTSYRASSFTAQLAPGCFQKLSSRDIGLSLGVHALAVRKNALPRNFRYQSGGGTARLVSRDWIVWAKVPGRFEAGTPAIINIIAFAQALQVMRQSSIGAFTAGTDESYTVADILYHDEWEGYSGTELLAGLRKTMIGVNYMVHTAAGARPFINLDNGASTPAMLPVYQAARKALQLPATVQQEIISEVRAICSSVFNAPMGSYDILFTSNTTEAINIAAENFRTESGGDGQPVIVNTLLEHNSNDLPWRMIPQSTLVRLSIDPNGFIDLTELETLLRDYNQQQKHGQQRIRLVAVSGASNVLGVYNDLAEISRIVHQYGARLLVDAAQMAAHRKMDMEGCGIDYLAFSAHKAYAPFGCGVLAVRKACLSLPTDELEVIRLSGEENTAGIAALGKSLLLLERIGFERIQREEQILTARVLNGLAKIPGITVFGIRDPASPEFVRRGGVIVFSLKGIMAPSIAKELSHRAGIGIRSGCHCSHLLIKQLLHVGPGLEKFQHILVQVFPGINLPGLARISLGLENTEEDVDTFLRTMSEISGRSGSGSP